MDTKELPARRARIIGISNFKGGAAKTTTAVCLSAALALEGYKVCLFDMDSQGHVYKALCSKLKKPLSTIAELIAGHAPFSAAVTWYNENLAIIPSNRTLFNLAIEIAKHQGFKQHKFLRNCILKYVPNDFDFIVIDCAPDPGLLTTNALVAADFLFVPSEPSTFGLEGVKEMAKIHENFIKQINPDSTFAGIIPIRFNTQTNVGKDTIKMFKEIFDGLVMDSIIRQCTSIEEAHKKGVSIYDHKPSCYAGLDYDALAREVVERTSK